MWISTDLGVKRVQERSSRKVAKGKRDVKTIWYSKRTKSKLKVGNIITQKSEYVKIWASFKKITFLINVLKIICGYPTYFLHVFYPLHFFFGKFLDV